MHFRYHHWLPALLVAFCLCGMVTSCDSKKSSLTNESSTAPPEDKITKLQKSAELGDADAQLDLGRRYAQGRGVVKDEVEAAQWFRKAAEQGLVITQLILGDCYARGEGVVKDNVEAAQWFRKAAEQGDSTAQLLLGRCYDKGDGVVKDAVEAYKWWNLAAASGNQSAGENREIAAKVMTPDQITEAQRLSREWKPNK